MLLAAILAFALAFIYAVSLEVRDLNRRRRHGRELDERVAARFRHPTSRHRS